MWPRIATRKIYSVSVLHFRMPQGTWALKLGRTAWLRGAILSELYIWFICLHSRAFLIHICLAVFHTSECELCAIWECFGKLYRFWPKCAGWGWLGLLACISKFWLVLSLLGWMGLTFGMVSCDWIVNGNRDNVCYCFWARVLCPASCLPALNRGTAEHLGSHTHPNHLCFLSAALSHLWFTASNPLMCLSPGGIIYFHFNPCCWFCSEECWIDF